MAASERHPRERRPDNHADSMQNVGMQDLRYESPGTIQGEGRGGRFSLRAMRVHNRHIQNVKAWYTEQEDVPWDDRPPIPTCICLREGLAGFITEAPEERRDARRVAVMAISEASAAA